MAYTLETSRTSDPVNWKPGGPGSGRVVTGITIHHWGGNGQNFDTVVDFLCSPRPANPTSAHYVVQGADADGTVNPRVACIVSPDDIAYACGNWDANVHTESIECRPEGRPADLEIVAELIADIWKAHGQELPLYPHSHWCADDCPGDNYRAQLNWLATRAREINSGSIPASPAFALEDTLATLNQYQTDRLNTAVDRILGAFPQRYRHPDGSVDANAAGGVPVRYMDSADGGSVVSQLSAKIAALQEVVNQLATKQGQPLDLAAVEKAAHDGAASALGTLHADITVTPGA